MNVYLFHSCPHLKRFGFLRCTPSQSLLSGELKRIILRQNRWATLPQNHNKEYIFTLLSFCSPFCYPHWFCHSRITSFYFAASKCWVHIKASGIFCVRSTREQVIHSRIIFLCYLWTIRSGLHLMCHRNHREACGESSTLPEQQS